MTDLRSVLFEWSFQDRITETGGNQPAVHDIERGGLLGNEQHGFPIGQALRDHVGDGLALARPRRTDQHEIGALGRGDHGGEL